MNSRISSYFFFILLFAAVVAAVLILFPFLTPLVLAIAAAVIVYPVYSGIHRFLGTGPFKNTIAALITVILTLVVILVPLFFLAGSVYSEVQTLYGMLIDEANRSQVIDALNTPWKSLSSMVFGVLPQHSFDSLNITEYLKSILEWVFSNLDNVFSSLAKVVAYSVVFLLALFYFLRDGEMIKKRFISWSPLLDANDAYITQTFKKAIRSVLAGTLAVSLIDGVSIGLSFLTFGIPAPALWGTVAAIAALVPGFGTSLVVLPAVAYLVFTGSYVYAAGLLVWGYATIFIVDHILGPSLVNRGIHIHPFLILLSVLGGLLVFGIVGFVMGPLILVFLITLLDIYKNSFVKSDTKI